MQYSKLPLNYSPSSDGPGSFSCRAPMIPAWQTSRGFAYNVQQPQSCSAERTKVTNLRALLRSSEADLLEIEHHQKRSDFLNTGLLISGLVMDTSIGFLDLAASLFASISPQTAKVAKAGILAIESTEQIGEAVTGQRSYASAAGNIFDKSVNHAASSVKTETIAGKVMLSTAKLHYDATVITIKATVGSSAEEIKKDAFSLIANRSRDNANIVADGLKMANNNAASKTLKGLVVVSEVYEAASNYQNSLEGRFNTYLAQQEADAMWVMNSKVMFRKIMQRIRGQLDVAIAELEACELG